MKDSYHRGATLTCTLKDGWDTTVTALRIIPVHRNICSKKLRSVIGVVHEGPAGHTHTNKAESVTLKGYSCQLRRRRGCCLNKFLRSWGHSVKPNRNLDLVTGTCSGTPLLSTQEDAPGWQILQSVASMPHSTNATHVTSARPRSSLKQVLSSRALQIERACLFSVTP